MNNGTPSNANPGQADKAAKPVPVQVVLKQVADLYTKGQYVKAQNLCAQVIKQRPRLADAHSMLGVILQALGRDKEARNSIRQAIKFNPTSHYYSNLGELERQNGKLEAASVALKKAIELDASYPQAHNNLGIVHFDQGEFEEAVECYKKCIELQPDYPEAHNNLGNAYRALRENADAMTHYEKAVELRENYPEAYNNMGSALRGEERFEEAEFCYRKAIGMNPKYTDAVNNLALMLMARDRHDDSLRVLDDALKSGNRSTDLYLTVAKVQLQKGNHDMARKASQLVLEEEADSAEAYTVLGQIDHDLDLYADAVENFEKAIKLKPDYVEARNYYGIALKSIGRLDDAREQFEQTLTDNPKAFGAYSNIADLIKFNEKPELVEQMETIFAEAEDPDAERFMGLHFAMGKAYDDLGRYEEAFKHISKGADFKRARLSYNEEEIGGFFNSIKETFDADYFKNLPYEGDPTDVPIFVVGMPRSGSTLVEQIISSHPSVYGAGEIKTFSHALGTLRSRFPALPKFPAIVGKMKPDHFKSVSDHYLNFVKSQMTTETKVTDKLLTNYYFLGLLVTLFPNAKFVHTKRNPIDTCLSAYTKLFKDDMPHSYNLGELGRYYRMYEDLMQHWHKVLPEGKLTDAVYEDVVANTEDEAKRLVAHCGLEWDDECLAFHKSSRPVKTASVAQVRKPVYKTSVERWKRYEKELQPLVEALGLK